MSSGQDPTDRPDPQEQARLALCSAAGMGGGPGCPSPLPPNRRGAAGAAAASLPPTALTPSAGATPLVQKPTGRFGRTDTAKDTATTQAVHPGVAAMQALAISLPSMLELLAVLIEDAEGGREARPLLAKLAALQEKAAAVCRRGMAGPLEAQLAELQQKVAAVRSAACKSIFEDLLATLGQPSNAEVRPPWLAHCRQQECWPAAWAADLQMGVQELPRHASPAPPPCRRRLTCAQACEAATRASRAPAPA